MKYRKEIDGLRAIAVLPVILFHAGFTVFGGGYVGVDIFFVISGYLITTIIVDEMDKGSFSLLKFYERRARRILPALFFVMLCTLPFAWLWMLPQDLKSFSQSLVAVPLFASNVLFWLRSGYFDPESELKPLLHTWSLAVEEQYYVLFPVFLMLAWKFGKKRIIFLLAMIAIISLLAAQWGSGRYPSFTFYLLPTRAFEILIGALVSLYTNHKHRINSADQPISQLASLTGLALVLYAIFAFDKNTPSPSLYTLIPTIGTILIIVYSNKNSLVGRLLGSKPFVGIGLISYSAYLWHQPLLAFARYESPIGENQILLGLMALVSLVLGYASWQYIEKPFRDSQTIGRSKILIFVFVGSLFFLSIGYIGHSNGGHEFRLPIASRDSNLFGNIKTFHDSRRPNNSCIEKLNLSLLPEEVCLASSNEPEILFAGDSHAMSLYSSIYGNSIELKGALISGHSCPLYPELTYTPSFKKGWGNNCTNISNKVVHVAKRFDSIKTIVIVNYLNDVSNNPSIYSTSGKKLTNKEAFEAGYSNLIKELLNLNKRVIFFIDVPHAKFDPKRCLQELPYSLYSIPECRFEASENTKIREQYMQEVYKLKTKFPSLIIFDPTELFCNENYCEIEKNKRALYFDKDHISVYASELLVRKMSGLNLLN